MYEHFRPNTVLFPACVTLGDIVPLTIIVGLFTPRGAGAQNPVNCLNETSAPFLLARIGTSLFLQECVKFLPMMVGDLIGNHLTFVAYQTKYNRRQRYLNTCVSDTT